MFVSISLTQAVALASFHLCFSHAFEQPPNVGPGQAPSDGFATFITASNPPNITHSVQFSHIDTTSTDPAVSQDWTWSVSVSDVSMANASMLNDSGVYQTSNAHVAYTTYKFSWPESGDLNQALQAEANITLESYQSCAILVSAILPQDVSNGWNASSSDCTSALGSACVDYLATNWTTKADCDASIPFTMSDPGLFAACSTSFGVLESTRADWGLGGYAFGNITSNATSINKGDVYAYSVSEPYTGGNSTAFDIVANNLQVLILTGQQSKVLCNRAGNGSSTAGGHDNAASTLSTSVVVACLVVLVTMVTNFL